MAYLQPSEYVSFGLSADTADAWVAAASAMMDAHCRRSSLGVASYTERLRVSRGRGTVQLSYGPVQQITALQVRYARTCEAIEGSLAEMAMLFGLPGQWTSVDVAGVSVDTGCGEVQLPANFLGVPYSEVDVTYSAGLVTIPAALKVACAQIVKNAQATPGLNVRSSKLDTLQTEYFSDALLDVQVRSMLRPYVCERLG